MRNRSSLFALGLASLAALANPVFAQFPSNPTSGGWTVVQPTAVTVGTTGAGSAAGGAGIGAGGFGGGIGGIGAIGGAAVAGIPNGIGAVIAAANGRPSTANTTATTIAALKGTLQIVYEDGRPPVTIDIGKGVVLDAQGNPIPDSTGSGVRTLADLLKADTSGALKASIMTVVQETAKTAASGTNQPVGSDATKELAALMKVVATADPAGAKDYVTAAVTALTQSGAASTTTATIAIAAVVEGAKQGGANVTEVTTAATTTAQANGVNVTTAALQSSTTQNALSYTLTTTPVQIDVSVVSRSGG